MSKNAASTNDLKCYFLLLMVQILHFKTVSLYVFSTALVYFFYQFIEKRREMKQEGRTEQDLAESYCFLFPDKSKVSVYLKLR